MIGQIRGKVQGVSDYTLLLDVSGISYEVQIPASVLQGLSGKLNKDSEVALVTYHYHQTDPSKSIPILIGFANKIERDFFEKFITVSGVGPKAAVRALAMPIPDIAHAIDTGDLSYLKSLPGIGEQRAKEIIAKLQGKMGKFGLMRSSSGSGNSKVAQSASQAFEEEALEVLLQLQYKKEEAKEMIRKALTRKPSISSAEEILNEVYRQKKTVGV